VQSENRYISIIDDITFRCRWTRLIYSFRSAFLFHRHLCKFYCSCSLSGQSTRSELLAPVNSFKNSDLTEYYRIPYRCDAKCIIDDLNSLLGISGMNHCSCQACDSQDFSIQAHMPQDVTSINSISEKRVISC